MRRTANPRVHPSSDSAITSFHAIGRGIVLVGTAVARLIPHRGMRRLLDTHFLSLSDQVSLVSFYASQESDRRVDLIASRLLETNCADLGRLVLRRSRPARLWVDSFDNGRDLAEFLRSRGSEELLAVARLFRGLGHLRTAHCLRDIARSRYLEVGNHDQPSRHRAQYDAGSRPLQLEPSRSEVLVRRVKGKRIAVVGGGVPEGDFSNSIDSCDLVVRLKYLGDSSLPSTRATGSRCDITAVNAIDGEVTSLLESRSDMLVIHRDRSKRDRFCYIDSPVRAFTSASSLGPKVLGELLAAGAGSVELYGFDLYTNKGLQSVHSLWRGAGPRQNVLDREDYWYRCAASASHEALSQRNIFRNLILHSRVTAHGILRDIISWDEYHFVEQTKIVLDGLRSAAP